MHKFTLLSIVIPVYNSAKTLPILVKRLTEFLEEAGFIFEIILINDGSKDESWEVIQELALQYSTLRGITLMRNYGQHNALLCGIRSAQYPVIITMDDDLQHPPEEITKLVEKLGEGYDVVYGIPRVMSHSFIRNFLSKTAKRLMARVMGIKDIRDINAFRAFKTDLRKAFAGYQSPNLLLDVLLSWGSNRFTAIPVNHQPRKVGKSNYNFRKLFNQLILP